VTTKNLDEPQSKIINSKELSEKNWKDFALNDIFSVASGKRLETRNKNDGKRPFIGATDNNNGITGFVSNENSSKDRNVLGVNYNGAPGLAFYHPYECIFTDDVKRLHLKNHDDNELTLLGFIPIFAQQHLKYSYGYKFNEQRMVRQKLLLPITPNQGPDYKYMATYTQTKRTAMLQKYCFYIEKQLAKLGEIVDIPALNEKTWGAFSIVKLFDSIAKGKISNASKLVKTDYRGIEYIAATNRNNGCLYFLEDNKTTRSMLQNGNCIGFIKDGDGSAGYAIYKREKFTSTVNVIYGYSSWLNEYNGLFFVTTQDMIQSKYSHGNKRNKEHLSKDKVMLPINEAGNPDYAYMEQYAKNLMIKKYKQYLNFIANKYSAPNLK